jgi:hypothetical protein
MTNHVAALFATTALGIACNTTAIDPTTCEAFIADNASSSALCTDCFNHACPNEEATYQAACWDTTTQQDECVAKCAGVGTPTSFCGCYEACVTSACAPRFQTFAACVVAACKSDC